MGCAAGGLHSGPRPQPRLLDRHHQGTLQRRARRWGSDSQTNDSSCCCFNTKKIKIYKSAPRICVYPQHVQCCGSGVLVYQNRNNVIFPLSKLYCNKRRPALYDLYKQRGCSIEIVAVLVLAWSTVTIIIVYHDIVVRINTTSIIIILLYKYDGRS